ncbi:heme lyase NrfEFG subunit NrfF [Glaesserella parasuis]|uniref:heme lyase NrfEFG subunit NrfF n=1 Tax=Glaesserella parasuis TaxID=738 RepID=UPI000991E592|nr:heme lyase NrfEFG subunit NrfF [Glaesserella parasuis]MCT8526130.1 heme lyase NrfEFG subunit NrfF [Glaesserella parasuis]MCT8528344.1 heme lyase NrfEFG subunit NrfF [Glaesserella parasuis]MCT8530258.1 heme lyase NrfEFG subunit NrfF [Glaesserella parasuis]MCT8531752.1 heme lyase NrfEFG subunit NrfF [Glaesserella parasuis]MCT8538623.1 heme lyase NrfEFG subunit NrfF [Glaesserella parasuis]
MKRILFLLFSFIALVAQAEMVDTFQFHSDSERIRAINLAKSLRCLQCQNQNLVESNASQAYKLRIEVYEMVNQGKSDQEIIQTMTERFGDFVHYQPPFNPQTWVLWGMPVGLLILLFSLIFWRTRRKQND